MRCEANCRRVDPAARLHLAPLPQKSWQPAPDIGQRADLLPPPAGGDGGRDERELGREQRRGQESEQAGRVDPDQEGPAVSLEHAPLVLARAELVLVVDYRCRLDPEDAAT